MLEVTALYLSILEARHIGEDMRGDKIIRIPLLLFS
jgi:hypothetical protein